MRVERTLVERVEQHAVDVGWSLAAAMAALEPASGAVAAALGHGVLVSTGGGMYVNRGVGIGVQDTVDAGDLDTLEAFFTHRGVPAELELCPWVDQSLLHALEPRGYGPRLFRDVFVRGLDGVSFPSPNPLVAIEAVTPDGWPVVHAVRADGFEETDRRAREISLRFSAAAASVPGTVELLARIGGAAVGAASLQVHHRVASFGGMSTVPSARGRGVQTAMLQHRLRLAKALGCDLVTVTAVPNSTSARNIRRHDFTLAYTQVIVTQRRVRPSGG